MKKYLSAKDASRIIKIYKQYKINYFPRITEYNISQFNSYIDFEWIEGSVIEDDKLPDAFYLLGTLHKQNKIKEKKTGFITICHGDFHQKNIIQNQKGIFFVDVIYINEGWNYSDLCYLDLFNLFPSIEYPWYIKSPECYEAYLRGLCVNFNEQTKDFIRKEITKYMLNYNINNGIKNGIDVEFEKNILKKFLELS